MPERPQPPPVETRRRRSAPDWGGDELFRRMRSREPAPRDDAFPWPESTPDGGGARDEVDRELAALIAGRRRDDPPAGLGSVRGVGDASVRAEKPAGALGDASGRAATPGSGFEAAARRDGGAAAPSGRPAGGAGGRRTVRITGRPGETRVSRRRPPRRAHERLGPRPDRVAAWAVALGLLLVLIAIATADAAVAALVRI